MDALQVDLYRSIGYIPFKWKQSVPVRQAAVAAAEDPQCAVVVPVSFWRLGGGACWWSTATLAFVSVVCRGRGDKSDLQLFFLAFSCSLHCFGPCLNMRYTRNILALEIWLGQ